MSGQDWEDVVIRKKAAPKPKSNDEALRMAAQSGQQVDTAKKFNAGKNVQKQQAVSTKKLENDEELTIPKVSHSLALRIQQARLAASLTQKELATKINEKPSVINDYENGKAIPNQQIISKLERALGVKLRGE
eukprot:TRINITY_DN1293_c0_g1_i2.p1 TRINITY_DN1293_c0_g1~~TRINITY_DN1293_c0_g1_i2.p1  ORF type:complete len:133 (+),score=51.64 TRINITY_DN1293_c0_g1_i2:114-512(+)